MSLFLFHGPDVYSHREKLKFWRREFEKKHGGDTNIALLDGKTTTASEIMQICGSLPFLGEKRLTIVKDFLRDAKDEERHALADDLEKIPDFCVLIFSESEAPDKRLVLYKKLLKLGEAMEFTAPAGSKLTAWIEKTVEKLGGTISREAVLLLTQHHASDLYRLENNIAKLAGYADNREITKADIELLLDMRLETSIFRLTDSIGQKNSAAALQTLHHLIDSGEELHGILSMIMRQFRIIAGIGSLLQEGASREAMISKLKVHPFVVSNTIPQAKNFSPEQLARAYDLLVDIDTKLKSGGIKILTGDSREFVLAMDRLVLALAR